MKRSLNLFLEANQMSLTSEPKKVVLCRNQKKLLDTFLEHNAITKDEYDISCAFIERGGI